MEGKTMCFRGAYGLSGTRIVDCSEIIDVWCNLNSLVAWPDWPWAPHFMTDLRYWYKQLPWWSPSKTFTTSC